jgi:hypothetical protein
LKKYAGKRADQHANRRAAKRANLAGAIPGQT